MNKFKRLFENNPGKKLTAVLFLLVIFGMLIGMMMSPRAVAGNFITTYRTNVPTGAPIIDRITGAIDAAENAVNEGAFCRQDYVELYGLAQRVMGKRAVTDYNYGALYKTSYDQIAFAVGERYIDDSCAATGRLANEVLTAGMDFLYIQLPYKIPPDKFNGNDQLPENVHDYANENADRFLEALRASGVKTYDLRDDFWSSGMTQNELFFNTDHHWTIEGAFLATGLIADYLNKNYDMQIPEGLYSKENFKFETEKDVYLGSMGRRVGRIYGGLDDFTLITPKFETDYTLTQIDYGASQEFNGSFEEAVLDRKYMEGDDVANNRYAVYHGDNEELRFYNHLAQNDKKVLIIKDSFGIPIYSFLSLGIREVRALDMRLFTRNVAEYAKEYDPDIVILMYNADSFTEPMFNFHLTE